MKYKIQVWFRYYRNGQSEKDSEILENIEAENEKQAKRKAADHFANQRVIPYKTEII